MVGRKKGAALGTLGGSLGLFLNCCEKEHSNDIKAFVQI